MKRYVIVGAGLAGHRAAVELRRIAPTAEVVLIGAEPHLPYDRPPLSKDFLLGAKSVSDLALATASDYEQLHILHKAATEVIAIERSERRVRLAGGEMAAYDALLLATGSRPRRMSYEDQAGAICLRTVDDAMRLKASLHEGARVVIIGGGFIGLEVAAVAIRLGCRVSVVEAGPAILARGLPPIVGKILRRIHSEEGVEFHCGAAPLDVIRSEQGLARVCLPGRELVADVVVIGAGVVPNTELAEQAGLHVSNGIVVDQHCRTSDPAIFAAGEVTAHPAGQGSVLRRLESWQVAMDQSRVAAISMTGGSARYDAIPWLWSDQYDCNLQVMGSLDMASTIVCKGDLQSRHWTLIALNALGQPTGAAALNNGRDISMLRHMLAENQPIPADWLSQFGAVNVGNWGQALEQESQASALGIGHDKSRRLEVEVSEAGSWHQLFEASELPPGEMLGIEIDDVRIAIYNIGGTFYATKNVCTHAFALLSDGWLEGKIVECPLHGGRFDVTTGTALGDPVTCDLVTFPLRVIDGQVEIKFP